MSTWPPLRNIAGTDTLRGALLAAHDTPFCSPQVEIVPYDGITALTFYATVILNTRCGRLFLPYIFVPLG